MTFSAAEKHQSQIPTMQLLVALGFQPLSQADALALRGGRAQNVLLEGILVDQLLRINRFKHRARSYHFDLEDAYEAIRRLRPHAERLVGLRLANQATYDLLVLGTTITQKIKSDSKSYSFRYIDWENPENNVYHVTAEMAVERTGSAKTRRCDVVAFVNGIPFVVVENKRPTEKLEKARSQLIGYQRENNIPHLFHFAQLLLALNRANARYATVGTGAEFWQRWRDAETASSQKSLGVGGGATSEAPWVRRDALEDLVNRPLGVAEANAVYSGDLADARPHFDTLAAEGSRQVTEQDRAIHALCRPERLLDLVRRFTVFDGGIRKIARHQQYFAVLSAMDRVKHFDLGGARKGGVIWHTQGSGKSLTMVMLGRALALDRDIESPRIIIVTDRRDLDRQIEDTFRSCELEPVRARSGRHLGQLIRDKTPLITTLVNKFETALRTVRGSDDDPNIFVLVDESHRTHTGFRGGHGQLALSMRRLLPQACYLGFTGTPLLSGEKNTLASFGGLIHQYAIDEAVRDKAVVPLLYEGRMVDQKVTPETIDGWFEQLCRGLTEEQKADLKRKFSRMEALTQTEQAIHAKAYDISAHYRQHWQDTGFKAQLVAPSKAAAVRFKAALDGIGHLTSEVVISAPDDREGNEDIDRESSDLVRKFWSTMMERYGSETEYNRRIIEDFKHATRPEILIVVSKLLTGFDAPRNTVLYLCRSLREHTLLQAIARVNRLYETEDGTEKKFGFIVDYEGLLGELDQALTTYSAFEGYDAEDLVDAVHDVRDEIQRLRDRHGALWDRFRDVPNKHDMEALEQFLADEAIRQDFYRRLQTFSRCLHISFSSEKVHDVFSEAEIATLKRDWRSFSELRRSVRLRYQEAVDIKEFEPKIRQLLDDHVAAMPAETIIELVDIHDSGALQTVLEEAGISDASKADRIASATRHAITENMERDPAFYRRFSELIEETIREYRERRISEREYLDGVKDLARQVAGGHRTSDVPETLRGDDDGLAFFGIFDGALPDADKPVSPDEVADIALDVIRIIKAHHIVDVWSNETAQNDIRNAIDDYFYDVLTDERGIQLTETQMDDLLGKIMRLARARFPG